MERRLTNQDLHRLMPDTYSVDTTRIRDISSEVLDFTGRLRILPATYWAGVTVEERALFCHRHGIYNVPTVELVERLRTLIDGRSAIEIAAGTGALAAALDIPATDSRVQETEPIRSIIALQGQPPVPYGSNVECYDAYQAIRAYRPQVVIGCWATQKYDDRFPQLSSSAVGIDEHDIINRSETYILVGNERVHQDKQIWKRPHTIEYPPYVYSRAQNGTRNFIAVWPGGRAR